MATKIIHNSKTDPKYLVGDLLRVELQEMKRLHHPLWVQHMARFIARQKALGLW